MIQLDRIIQNETTKLHRKILKKIQKIMKIDRNKAQFYKAALQNKIKKEFPKITGIERASKIIKMARYDVLKKLES